MSVLVFVPSPEGKLKKGGFEAVTYAYHTAQALETDVVALVLGATEDPGQLGQYGAAKVLHADDASFDHFDSQQYTAAITQAAEKADAKVIILAHDSYGKSLLGRLSAKLDAASVPGAKSVPTVDSSFKVEKNVFSGKAIATYELATDYKVISVMGNSVPPENVGAAGTVEAVSFDVPPSRITVKEVNTVKGTVPLPEAELVVSAGRGMKGPENWGIIEELADILGATTACSRPVSDIGWRPHHEHVGQTGVAIRPNLYFAIGISGAIQHLAGVNQSKVIVVINKDPEAPFFKAADYGIVGDLFDVVPRLNEALKNFKAQNA
ncbi:MAG: electron transfer flavoprotein subunit alpha/FixB family protein [Bacteroidota bacterium]